MSAPSRGRPAGPAAPTARGVALTALVEVAGGARANVVLPRLLGASSLERRDRAFATELTYGTCRMQRACDWLVDRHVRGRTDAEVRAALRLGAYQLAWTRVPPHAAVAATVAEVGGPGRSLVNAVLRRVADDVARGPVRWPDPATALSYPDWVVARLGADLGPAAARAALEQMNVAAAATERDDGYIQDPASQMVAAHVGARPGERVLDLCAAPGGKATALAGAGAALVVAADVDPGRSAVVAGNAARLGLATVAAVVADGRRPPLRPGAFDRVLVDAPCSGLGVLRRRPDARWRSQPGDLPRLAALQRELLDAAVPLVRPGGTLVYSVCTLTREETAGIDRWLAAAHPDLVPLPPPGSPWVPAGRGGLLLPQAAGTDGMFALALRRPAYAEHA
ncbi:MAG TPA: transcription antitermination factor NusB [Acidimicrobiales bacterium]|nr:transcription antitermination factor NusB [Acidimicrobiales bacterium]